MVDWDVFYYKFRSNKQKAFQDLCDHLFCYKYNQPNGLFSYKNNPYLEALPITYGDEVVGFQAKCLEPETKVSNYEIKIKKTIESAKKKHPSLTKIVLYLNKSLTASPDPATEKPAYQKRIEKCAADLGVELEWCVPSQMAIQLGNNALASVRRYYFEENTELHELVKFKDKLSCFPHHIDRTIRLEDPQNTCTLLEALQIRNNIVLLGDAASGKSEELKSLFNQLIDDENYYPYYFPLKEYDGKDIKEIIPENYEKSASAVLLFDALEEVQPEHLSVFITKINTFTRLNRDVKIIVSSRYNFFIKSSLSEDHYIKAHLCELTETDIISFSKKQLGKPSEEFLKELKKFNDSSLLNNPFYLVHNIELYEKNKKVYDKVSLMRELFDLVIEKDKRKYKKSTNTDIKKEMLISTSAVALEFVSRGLTNKTINIESIAENRLHNLKMFAWINYNEENNVMGFIHNNYKEYLAAVALSQMNDEEIIKTISVEIDKTYIKPQFANAIGFLLKLVKDSSSLKRHLLECGKEILMDTDNVSLNADEKLKIVKSIIEEYEAKQSWLSAALYKEEKIAKICDNIKTLTYLISKLDPSLHKTTVLGVLQILSSTKSLLGKENEVKTKLFQMLKNKRIKAEADFVSKIIYNLTDIGLSDVEAKKLYLQYCNADSSDVRAAANYIAHKNKLGDYFVKRLLQGYNRRKVRATSGNDGRRDFINLSESYHVSIALKEISTDYALVTYADYVINEENKYRPNSVTENFFEKVLSLPLISDNLKERLYTILLALSSYKFRGNIKRVREIILKFGLSREFLARLKNSTISLSRKVELLAIIYCEEVREAIFELIVKNKLFYDNRDAFVNHLRWQVEDIDSIISWFATKGVVLRLTSKEREKAEKQRQLRSFNELFSEDVFKVELRKVFANYKTDKINIKEIRKLPWRSKSTYPNYIMDYFMLIDERELSLQDIESADFEWIRYHLIYKMLESSIIEVNTVTEEQKQFLKQWCDKHLEQVDFTTAIKYQEDDSFTTSWNAIMLALFIILFDFPVDKKVYEAMIYFGWIDNQKHLGTLSFVKDKMTKEEFDALVVRAINSDKMKKMVLEKRLKYCTENKLDGILDYVIKMLEDYDKENHYYYHVAIDYLEAVGHLDDALHFFDKFNTDLKRRLIDACIKTDNKAVIPLLEKEIAKDNEESIIFASFALEMKNESGIKYYIDWVKKNKKTYAHPYAGINFKKLDTADDLGTLFKFLELSYIYLPEDRFGRLIGSINEAILAIGIQSLENIKLVVSKHKEFIKNNRKIKNINYQHYYIDIAVKNFLDNCVHM